jgi:hypothetical protein
MILSLVHVSGEVHGKRERWAALPNPKTPSVGPMLLLFCSDDCRHDGLSRSRKIHLMCDRRHLPWCAHIRDSAPYILIEETHAPRRRGTRRRR